MKEYYTSKCKEYNKNTKQLWQMINSIVSKTKHTGRIIPFITIDGAKTYDPKKIADEFGSFYANLGADLAKKIPNSQKSVNDYVAKIPRTLNSLVIKKIEYPEVE